MLIFYESATVDIAPKTLATSFLQDSLDRYVTQVESVPRVVHFLLNSRASFQSSSVHSCIHHLYPSPYSVLKASKFSINCFYFILR